MPDRLPAFLAVVCLLTVTPGPDMVLVIRNGLRAGRRAAWATGLGCCLGIGVHACAAVLGLSAVLAASDTLYAAFRLAGAAYLAWLGVRALLAAVRARAPLPASGAASGIGPDVAPGALPDPAPVGKAAPAAADARTPRPGRAAAPADGEPGA
ncbi:LysE family translocator, partial [Streptomyces sp. B1866]|uniref:LysE family translocator n=1 Tax=Streptomyces sp. B1866 TaxID=3075431 RepID=UPI00288F66B8